MDHWQQLGQFIASGQLDVPSLAAFPAAPGALAHANLADRVRGMLLGLAIGDALGNTSESLKPADRYRMHGDLRDYLPNTHASDRKVGVPSDDTQLAFWTLESILDQGRLDLAALARVFTSREIFGIGKTVRAWRGQINSGMPWYVAAQRSAGNGALMRIAPVLLPHLRAPDQELWADVALAAALTHNDATSTGCCVAYVAMLWELLAMTRAPDASWWHSRFADVLRPFDQHVALRSRVPHSTFAGPLSSLLATEFPVALGAGESVLTAGDRWYSGAFLLETVPSALYILARHGADPEEAMVRAVNDTWDNDTIAAIVGGAVGALHGASRLPGRWVASLLGRTGRDDDGAVQRLIDRAIHAFVA